jgi:hypothetical protein
MERIYVFLIRNDVWIYIICGLGLVWYLSEFWRSRRMLRSAVYGLEKERGQWLQRRSLIFIIFFFSIISLVIYVNSNVAPSLPAELLKPPTPTPNIFSTPLSSPTSANPVRTPTIAIAPTVTLQSQGVPANPTNVGETESNEPVVDETPTIVVAVCSADVNIVEPANRIPVSGEIFFYGSADGDRFDSYLLEAIGPQTGGGWLSITTEDGSEPVSDGLLGTANLSNWLPGLYTVRLTVLAADSIITGQCEVEILLQSSTP